MIGFVNVDNVLTIKCISHEAAMDGAAEAAQKWMLSFETYPGRSGGNYDGPPISPWGAPPLAVPFYAES